MNETNWRLCFACTRDPDPRGPSACFDCRELNRLSELEKRSLSDRPARDLSAAHVNRVALRLFRAFDATSPGRELLHDFDVTAQCEYENWRSLAREAIRLGAVVPEHVVETGGAA